MKKKILISIILIFFSTICYAGIIQQLRSLIAKRNAAAGPTTLLEDDFDSYSTGEINGLGAWTEDNASSNIFVVSTTQANSAANSLFDNNSADVWIIGSFTPTAAAVTWELYVYAADTTNDKTRLECGSTNLSTIANQGMHIRMSSSGDWDYYHGSWDTITTCDYSTGWNHVKFVMDPTTDTFDMYISDMGTACATDLGFRNDLSSISVVGMEAQSNGIYIDDVLVTTP